MQDSKTLYPIVGVKFRGPEAEGLVRDLRAGDPVRLVREPNNRVDRNAVRVYVCDVHVGFVPAHLARDLAPTLDKGGLAQIDGIAAIVSGRTCVEIQDPVETTP